MRAAPTAPPTNAPASAVAADVTVAPLTMNARRCAAMAAQPNVAVVLMKRQVRAPWGARARVEATAQRARQGEQ
eukprot:COSAG01_NODE_14784_length_1410_cov_2.409611_2_plen_74_part_00